MSNHREKQKDTNLQLAIHKFMKQLLSFTKVAWQQSVILYRNLFWEPSNWLKYAEKQSQLRNLDIAIAACDKAIAQDVDNVSYSAWVKKGYLLAEQQNLEDALHCFDRALSVYHNLKEVWHKKSQILSELKRDEEALISYDEAINIQPDLDLLWIEKGDILAKNNKHRLAADCYEKALQLKPKNNEIVQKLKTVLNKLQELAQDLIDRGNTAYDLGEIEHSIDLYEKAIEFQPNKKEAWYFKGIALAKLSLQKEALFSYEKALEIDSNHVLSLVGKADVLAAQQYYQEALDFCERALKIQPDNLKFLNQQNRIKIELQDLEKWTETLLYKGIDLHNSDDYEEAVKVYDQALELISKNLV